MNEYIINKNKDIQVSDVSFNSDIIYNKINEYTIINNIDSTINNKNTSNNDSNDSNNHKAILDKDKIDYYVGFLMVSLTTSLLFPYSSILSSLDYFDEVYPNYYTASTLPFVYMFTIAATYCLVLKVHHKTKHHYNILGGFIVYILVMITIPFINLSNIKGTLGSYILTVLLICSTAFVDSFIQSSVMSIAASFGSHYSIFCQIGFGFSGVLSTIIRIIIKLSYQDKDDRIKKGIIIFYSLSGFVIFLASLVFIIMLKSHIGKYIMTKDDDAYNNNKNNNQIPNSDSNNNLNQSPLRYVIMKNIHYNLILISLFTITLFIYPSFIYKIEFNDIRKDLYMVSITAVYSFCDFIGRIIPLFLTHNIKYKHSVVWVLTLSRSIFILLFFLQIYLISFRFKSVLYILLIIFGFSDGFLSSICVSEPPKQVEKEYKQLSGIVTSFSANIGLLLGSSINLLIMLLLF